MNWYGTDRIMKKCIFQISILFRVTHLQWLLNIILARVISIRQIIISQLIVGAISQVEDLRVCVLKI